MRWKSWKYRHSGRRIQWRPKVASAPASAKRYLDHHPFVKTLKELYKDSTDVRDRPILDLVWDYGDPPDVELVAREINGYALDNVLDATGKVLVEKGKILPALRHCQRSQSDVIACGAWIYSVTLRRR